MIEIHIMSILNHPGRTGKIKNPESDVRRVLHPDRDDSFYIRYSVFLVLLQVPEIAFYHLLPLSLVASLTFAQRVKPSPVDLANALEIPPQAL